MKKNLIPLLFALAILVSFAAMVSADEMTPKSIPDVLAEIRMDLGLADGARIDATKVSAELLVELGDSVMEADIGNSAMHDRMDNAIGGDGSASLEAYHINIALQYLAGNQDGTLESGFRGGMMGGYRGGMMGGYRGYRTGAVVPAVDGLPGGVPGAFAWVGFALQTLMLVGMIVLVLLLIRAVLRTSRPKR